MKRKLNPRAVIEIEASSDEEQSLFVNRKQRSKLTRRRRLHISPIVQNPDSSSYLTAPSEVSCDSSIASVCNQNPPENEFRRAITRSYYRKKFKNESRCFDQAPDLSDNSCVDSCSGAHRELKLKARNAEELEIGGEVTKSEVTSAPKGLFSKIGVQEVKEYESGNFEQSMELSDISCVESCSGANNRELRLKNRDVEESEIDGVEVTKSEVSSAPRRLFSEYDVKKVQENDNSVKITQSKAVHAIPAALKLFGEEITNSEAERDNSIESISKSIRSDEKTIRIVGNKAAREDLHPPELVALDINLACSEQFSSGGALNGCEDEEEEYSSSASELYHVVSDSEFPSSEYTPSIWSYASGSQFSEKSMADESSSPTFELFKQFKEQFCSSTTVLKAFDDQNSHPIIVLGLEDEEDEESYRMLSKRERRQEYVRDYADEYCHTTAYGELIIQQRLHMVHWIIEEATSKELQKETMFLGVNLLDRFLSKGYFKTARNLQIAGIACLTLATRIEENQPYNSIRKKTINVGSTMYSRSEVVAMEWLVQEVLNFQCYLPTSYNFLWFFLKAARANEITDMTAKYLAVLTLMGHQQLCFWPSTVAAGLVILATIATNQETSCHLMTSIHARNKDTDLPECIKSLEWLVKYI